MWCRRRRLPASLQPRLESWACDDPTTPPHLFGISALDLGSSASRLPGSSCNNAPRIYIVFYAMSSGPPHERAIKSSIALCVRHTTASYKAGVSCMRRGTHQSAHDIPVIARTPTMTTTIAHSGKPDAGAGAGVGVGELTGITVAATPEKVIVPMPPACSLNDAYGSQCGHPSSRERVLPRTTM
jgi:hypothetical protein